MSIIITIMIVVDSYFIVDKSKLMNSSWLKNKVYANKK